MKFAADGAPPLPVPSDEGYAEHEGARIWYAAYGSGPPVILLHGGLGHSGNWGYQVPALVGSGHRAVLIDSRGHGRSTRDARPVRLRADGLRRSRGDGRIAPRKASLVGWSDGADDRPDPRHERSRARRGRVLLWLQHGPERHEGDHGTQPGPEPVFRPAREGLRPSYRPRRTDSRQFTAAVGLMMQTQPNYSAHDLAGSASPSRSFKASTTSSSSASTRNISLVPLPNAELVILHGVSHFAPLQRPEQFNAAMLAFVGKGLP